MNEEVWWYATRAAGLMTWVTACGSVLIGPLLSRNSIKSLTRSWFFDLHRFLSGVSVIFLVTHLGTLYMYNTEIFTWRALLIPGESTWETTAASMGIIAFWSLIAVELTSLLQDRVSSAIWRVAHALAIVTVVAGSYHAWLGGSDMQNPITWAISGIGSLIAVGLITMHLRRKDGVHSDSPRKPDQKELLVQMQAQLECLPAVGQLAQPKLQPDSALTLPRRVPLGANADANDPLLAEKEPITSDNLFERGRFEKKPFQDTALFGNSDPSVLPNDMPPSPFRSHTPPSSAPHTAPTPHPEQGGHRMPARKVGTNPFISPEPPAPALTAPPEPPSQPSTAAATAPAPPSLPAETGEVDKAVYTAWLIEWLAFAEKYGDETPEDPTRI